VLIVNSHDGRSTLPEANDADTCDAAQLAGGSAMLLANMSRCICLSQIRCATSVCCPRRDATSGRRRGLRHGPKSVGSRPITR
jgi:hypothetical protein